MNDELTLDCRNLWDDAVGAEHGLSRAEYDALSNAVAGHAESIRKRRGRDIGFMELPYDTALAERIERQAEDLRSWCRHFVVLGIGGSALGNRTVHGALGHSFHNQMERSHPACGGHPHVVVLDNIDPVLMQDFFDFIAPRLHETAFNVITKSGSTAETMAQFLHIRELLEKHGGRPQQQIILTTDPAPERSLLRRIGRRDGYTMFPIPTNVGGRFSVLSAVGLLSAAVGGCNIRELLAGAAAMDARCSGAPEENPAAAYSRALFALHTRHGKAIQVLMPYSHRLQVLALWYSQLWAESLGKRDGLNQKDVFIGPTPVASTGVTDQHSVMQLYQDGPFDKVITFLEIDRNAARPRALPICERDAAEPDLRYLEGQTFDALFQAELRATRCALRDKQRPNCTIRIPELNAHALGELFMFFQYAVAYSGCLYDVNAFDQPGVELGKQYTYGLMGREGYEPPPGM